jgi:diguanylate cyclase (GGDEF)-like protein/PAS domain S-box-containing protein
MDKLDQYLILIIDDNPSNLEIICKFLTRAGYKTIITHNGEKGIESALEFLPDLILLDVAMPKIDGFETCHYLKSLQTTKEIPIIFLKAISPDDQPLRIKGLQLGAVDFINKPIREEEIILKVNIHLKLQNLNKQLQEKTKQLEAEIKERKKLEEALKKSEEKFAKAFRSNPDPVTISTVKEGRLIEVNQSFCRLTGYQEEEIIGKTRKELNLCKDSQESDLLSLVFQTKGEVRDREVTYLTKSGDIKTMLVSIEIIEYDGEQCFLILQKDITERKQVEDSLQQFNQELQQLVNIDKLTQVANRYCFDRYLNQEWYRLKREQAPLSLILSDVDYFKRYNDFYNHLTGDKCLLRVAQAINRAAKRPADLVARYGGEEFAVILPNTKADGAIKVAERIREEIHCIKIPHEDSEVNKYVTLSLGVATVIPEGKGSPADLISAADQALYKAKRQGRDRVVAYNP